MITNDIIEELPTNEPAHWISCSAIAPKPNIRMTLDARNINKAIQSSNMPILRQEDIKAKLSGSQIFSKLDFKNAFWQIQLQPDSRNITTFHCNGKLYRYKVLTMGLKPAQGELNAALRPIFSHIKNVHLIHDDVVIATTTTKDHEIALKLVMEAISNSSLILNPTKCIFGAKEIEFWGLLIGSDGVRPNPAKVTALDHITPPNNKDELKSFPCMMQANAEFIPRFSKKSAKLWELTRLNKRFIWTEEHTACFKILLNEFCDATTLHYFDPQKTTSILVDAHKTGLGATLAQGDDINNLHPIAIASHTTSQAESRYPQLYLEGISVEFGLCMFRNYVVGSPQKVMIITDHRPLCSIFNSSRLKMSEND